MRTTAGLIALFVLLVLVTATGVVRRWHERFCRLCQQ